MVTLGGTGVVSLHGSSELGSDPGRGRTNMIIEDFDALKHWLSKTLEPICDADPSALAKYVVALVKKDKSDRELKALCIDQLDVFLQRETQGFVDKLFEAVNTKSYLPPPEPTSTVIVKEDPIESQEREAKKEEVHVPKDDEKEKKPLRRVNHSPQPSSTRHRENKENNRKRSNSDREGTSVTTFRSGGQEQKPDVDTTSGRLSGSKAQSSKNVRIREDRKKDDRSRKREHERNLPRRDSYRDRYNRRRGRSRSYSRSRSRSWSKERQRDRDRDRSRSRTRSRTRSRVQEIKRKWHSARDPVRKESTAVPHSGSSDKRKRCLGPTMGTRPSSDNMDRTGVKAKEGNRSKAVAFPLETVTVSATSSQGAPSQRPSTAGPILPPSRPVAPTNLQVEMPREVLSLLQQPAAAQDPSDSFGQHVACLMRRLPENRQLKTQNYILYLLEMATPPNCPTELECLIENYKHQQTQCELGSIQMPPPQYLQHRSYMQSSSYLEALNTVYARIGQAYVAQSALRRAPGYTWQESVCGGTEHRQTAIPYTSQSAETIPRIQNM